MCDTCYAQVHDGVDSESVEALQEQDEAVYQKEQQGGNEVAQTPHMPLDRLSIVLFMPYVFAQDSSLNRCTLLIG